MSLAVEVREGAVEESERSESDDVGLRVLVGQRQAVVSTNDIKADVAQLAERAVAMAKVAPEDRFAGLADPRSAGARLSPISICSIPICPRSPRWSERAQERRGRRRLRSRA